MSIKPMPTPSELQKFAKEIYKGNSENGFWDNPRSSDQLTMLIKSEVFEAMECWRNRQDIDKDDFFNFSKLMQTRKAKGYDFFGRFQDSEKFKKFYKETKEVEIADAIIRVLDTMAHFNIPFLELERIDIESKDSMETYIELDKMISNMYDYDFNSPPRPNSLRLIPNLFRDILSELFSYDENLMEYAKVKVLYNTTREKMHGNKRA